MGSTDSTVHNVGFVAIVVEYRRHSIMQSFGQDESFFYAHNCRLNVSHSDVD